MGQNITESLATGTSDVEMIYEAANHAGLDVIKLVWLKKGTAVPSVMGYDVPTLRSIGNVDPINMDDENSVNLEFGQVRFYPDKFDNRWGYVIATKANLERMAHHIARGWYHIQTKSYREEVIKLAESLGVPTSYVAPKSEHVRATVREQKAEDKVTETLESNRELKAELAAAKAALKTAKEDARREVIAETLSEKSEKAPVIDDDGNEITTPPKKAKKGVSKK